MKLVAGSFAWPLRDARVATWAAGVITVLALPLLFIPLLGYAIAATRAAERDPSAGPPPWQMSSSLMREGGWTALAIALTVAPFAAAMLPLSHWLAAFTGGGSLVYAFLILALPWGLVALLLLPHATAAFAASGKPRDLFDVGSALTGVRRDFMTWNVVAAAIVTGWAVGVACVGLLCIGIVPGVFYAILVSAHAAAALHRPRQSSSAG